MEKSKTPRYSYSVGNKKDPQIPQKVHNSTNGFTWACKGRFDIISHVFGPADLVPGNVNPQTHADNELVHVQTIALQQSHSLSAYPVFAHEVSHHRSKHAELTQLVASLYADAHWSLLISESRRDDHHQQANHRCDTYISALAYIYYWVDSKHNKRG